MSRKHAQCLCIRIALFGVLVIGAPKLHSQINNAVASSQVYVQPTLWSGKLSLYRDESFKQLLIELSAAIEKGDSTTMICSSNFRDSELFSAFAKQSEQNKHDLSCLSIILATEFNEVSTRQLASYKRILVASDASVAESIHGLHPRQFSSFINELRSVLQNGGQVVVCGSCQWIGMDINSQRPSALLSDCEIVEHDGPIEDPPDRNPLRKRGIVVRVPKDAACSFSNRQLVSLGESLELSLVPTTSHHDEANRTLRKNESVDWTQWRRALLERQQPFFPNETKTRHALANGSLVIGGGGGMPLEVWQEFVALAGGELAHIVILPTAVESPSSEAVFEDRMMRNAGARSVITLPQIAFDEVCSDPFLQEIDKATGIWFGGGRQWRFVDAYWGTPGWNKIMDVCRRGGVIGGSSAGATIQGDLLVRGAPAGNQIMIADGYRRGLGLLPNTAIDQHFLQRNRFRDLENCIQPFPSIYGIGIDEQTALVITAPNRAKVLGNGSVWCYPSSAATAPTISRSETKVQHQSGSSFTLE